MIPSTFSHVSVLLEECLYSLALRDGYTYVDCTTGGGGHSLQIARRMGPHSRLICLDRDDDALAAATERLRDYRDRVTFIHSNYGELGDILSQLQIRNLGGVLADLGCSSFQFDTPERGFSYMHDARLDMRMDATAPLSAYEVINTYQEEQLARILSEYGEERFARRIAASIVRARTLSPIETTGQLSDLVKQAIPAAARQDGPHPAKRTFQAIRIEVNGELDTIQPMIEAAARHMVPGGRLAIISFHSLEDRQVKEAYRRLSSGCTCPRDFPICVCGKKPMLKEINKKPILPTEEELTVNPRSRSAKLRVAERL